MEKIQSPSRLIGTSMAAVEIDDEPADEEEGESRTEKWRRGVE